MPFANVSLEHGQKKTELQLEPFRLMDNIREGRTEAPARPLSAFFTLTLSTSVGKEQREKKEQENRMFVAGMIQIS